jgi:hypothetical protein
MLDASELARRVVTTGCVGICDNSVSIVLRAIAEQQPKLSDLGGAGASKLVGA